MEDDHTSSQRKHVIIDVDFMYDTRGASDLRNSTYDGYKWHKYGQKVLMDSDIDRSYYKCSHRETKCEARKSIDVSKKDPKRILVAYTKTHNHEKPKKSVSRCKRSFEIPMEEHSLSPTFTSSYVVRESKSDPENYWKQDTSPRGSFEADKPLEAHHFDIENFSNALNNPQRRGDKKLRIENASEEIISSTDGNFACRKMMRASSVDALDHQFNHFLNDFETPNSPEQVSNTNTTTDNVFEDVAHGEASDVTFGKAISRENIPKLEEDNASLNSRQIKINKRTDETYTDPRSFLGGRSTLSIHDFINPSD